MINTNIQLKKIDPKLASVGYSKIARAFTCKKCQLISSNFYRCSEKICEEIVCEDCKSSNICPTCTGKLSQPTLKGDIKEIMDSINFSCPNTDKGCSSICKLKDLRSHFEICTKKIIEHVFKNSIPAPANSFTPSHSSLEQKSDSFLKKKFLGQI